MPRRIFWLLAAANFVVALGYGVVLPLIPTLLAALTGAGAPADVAWHTGALLGVYMLGLFVSAPAWGLAVDRLGGHRLLVFGLVAYAASLLAFATADSLAAAYGWRALAGVAGGSVPPVVNAAIGAVADRPVRGRLFAGAAMTTLVGLIAGPAASGLVYGAMERMGNVQQMTATVIGYPLAGAAALALAVAAGCRVVLGNPHADTMRDARQPTARPIVHWHRAGPALSASFLLLLGLGAFEALLPVFGQRTLSLDPLALGALLSLCMVTMLAVEAAMFLAPVLHYATSGRSIVGGFLVVATGIGMLAEAQSFSAVALAVILIGAGGAFLQPAIVYLATIHQAGSSGTLLGALSSAGSLGQGIGSFAGGMLFAVLDSSGLWVVAATLAAGAVWIGTVLGQARRRD